MNTLQLHHGDCLEVMRAMPSNSVDSIVTDPPYGLSFMGKRWDYDVPSVDVWAECLRVLKPGGHLLAFAGTRTQHRMAVRIEDAGFEIRDMIAWVYGCLDEATEVATAKGVMPYHKTRIGDLVLCYDVEHGEYTYQPILEVVEYDYSDTAYRLVGDFGEQVVSRNHRVIVECGGSEAFNLAETLGAEARVPVLENLPALQQAVHDAQQDAGRTKQDVQQGVCKHTDWACEYRDNPIGEPQGQNDQVLGLRGGSLEAERLASESPYADVQPGMQRGDSRRPMGNSRTQGSGELVGRVGGGAEGTHDGRDESVMEGRLDVPESERCVCGPADQVCALPCSAAGNGSVGRLCDGAPQRGGAGDWSAADAGGVCAPHQPRCDGQPAGKSDAVCHERTAQGIRAWGGHRSAVVRVVPFHYTGKVWCLRVPTGAFVAVRNGAAFPTGNSGFPKSLDVSKAIDKAAGAVREVVGFDPVAAKRAAAVGTNAFGDYKGQTGDVTAPATDAARLWQGWGTALKPALEPITVARKPLVGTVAANVLQHGTGALNIDGNRVSAEKATGWGGSGSALYEGGLSRDGGEARLQDSGRWPANLIHDGSDEVAEVFGDPARFFYCAKASKRDRDEGLEHMEAVHRPNGNKWTDQDYRVSRGERPASAESGPRKNVHPTVKPTDLMRYLCRLVTPPGGVVLDPFTGSGTTGKAALLEGFQFIGIEREQEYIEIASARINSVANDNLLMPNQRMA